MIHPIKLRKDLLSTLLLLLLVACVQPAAVKDINANKAKYLDDNFSPQTLPQSVARIAPGQPKPRDAQRTLTITSNAAFDTDGKKENPGVVTTLRVLGNGLVQEMTEYSNNGIGYGIYYSLSYVGLFPLKEQRVFFNRQTANLPTEVKELTQSSDLTKPRENAEYVFAWQFGTANQLANFSNIKLICNSGTFYSATTVHPKLSGAAIDLNCTREINGIVRAKHKFVLLREHGVALKVNHQSSTTTETYTIVDVNVP